EMEELSNTDPALRAMKMMGDTLDYPTAIDDYLASNYPDLTIDEVELDADGNFVVTLSDYTELRFDADGVFIEIVSADEEDEDGDDEAEDEEDDDEEVTEWPMAIDDYVANNYPDAAIDEVELNADGTYEVELDDDTELLFDADGNFLEVIIEDEDENEEDEDDNEVTEWPASIDEYVAANHPDATIEEVEFEDDIYEVELDDDTELEFDADGNFIG
ncbi:MAG: PepSY-like domain-containing protein, partial [Saprospiraceae bacterium]